MTKLAKSRVTGHRLRKRAAAAPVASRLPLWPSRHDRRRPRARAHAAIFEGHSPGFASRLAEHLSAAPRGRRSMLATRLRPRPRPSVPDAGRPHRCIRPDPLPAHTDLLLHTSNGPSCESFRCDVYMSPFRVCLPCFSLRYYKLKLSYIMTIIVCARSKPLAMHGACRAEDYICTDAHC
ncbi:unnamed protein product [Euphydryas editha]|uniref:Uncharacterized protein n=1 Tax=Euphydryas editha TaxID=104508 RepID=A0AAU9TQU8_EUPED|nr:unnamed protein product [Euphydryas editha]